MATIRVLHQEARTFQSHFSVFELKTQFEAALRNVPLLLLCTLVMHFSKSPGTGTADTHTHTKTYAHGV